ncbi:hypothetical protein K3M67_05965 [Sphingobium sp. V4]|uniref:hypothetical protein n=1 Tax=Sphingobium sp. V4 TaxID=3038927 RepID=UPI002557DD32|nr:hypothetical protein [Sphingobium sp. V4]WIW89506.1 hypothetical protein K3M67_05965 [Sphingobium sp. V4]
MTSYAIGQTLPDVPFEPNSLAVIAANVATVDFFPGLIDPDYARKVGHKTVFMNTMTLLSLMDRFVLDWAPEGRVKSHELVMRKPAYAGMAVTVQGEVTGVSPFAGSNIAGPGTEIEVSIKIVGEDQLCTTGKVNIVVP